MPSKSEAQRKALYAKFGSAWVHEHHFDKVKPDPKVKPRGPHKTKGNRKTKGKVKK
jgi:hypothetical protein